MAFLPSIIAVARRLLLVQAIVALWTIEPSPGKKFANALSSGSSGSGFNYEIEKRVHERVSELMNVPVTMLGLVEQYSQTDVFEPPFLRPHQKDAIFQFMWTVWKEFNIDLYYGQEDGLFLGIIKGSGTYQEGRGSNGYRLEENIFDGSDVSEEDSYFRRLYYDKCLDRETGAARNCTLRTTEDYVVCVDGCKPKPCPSSALPASTADEESLVSVIEVDATEEATIYCPSYEILQVPDDSAMGYIPRYYYCLNNAGRFIENDPPNSVASPSSMKDGVCTHSDGITLVEGRTATRETYAMADWRNYLFLGNYDDQYASQEQFDAAAHYLYTDNLLEIVESQKTDDVFVGGHHSRRYEPRLRPWYIGTREAQNAFWTTPYPFATNNDMGISYGKPLYYTDPSTGFKVFRGVICVDYDLEEISRFLRDVFLEALEEQDQDETTTDSNSNDKMYSSSSGATVLIVEDEAPHYIIGSSTGSKATKKVRIDDETINCEDSEIFSGEFECKTVRSTPEDYSRNLNVPLDMVMANAFEAQKEAGFPKELVVSESNKQSTTMADKDAKIPEFYVSQSLIYEQSEGDNLKWRIIVAMPVGVAKNDDILHGDPMFAVVLVVGVVGCLACLFLFYNYFKRRKHNQVQLSDWRFTSAFILGCAFLNLATLTFLGQATDFTCTMRMWAFHFVFVLTLAPLLVKVWRIFKLVHSAGRAVRLSITNKKAMLYTMPAILLQALILTLFTIFDPAKRYTYVDIDGSSSSQHGVCRHDTPAFMITQVIFEGGLVLVGCVLAFKTRNLGSTLGEAKQLLFAMYNVAFVALIVLLMGKYLNIDQKSVYVIMTMGTFWATVFSSCAFVLPRILHVYREESMRRRNSTKRINGGINLGNRSLSTSNSGKQSLSDSYYTTKPITLPTHHASSGPAIVEGSLDNEPRSKMPSSSIASSDYDLELKQASDSPSNDVNDDLSFYSSEDSDGSDCDASLKEGDDEKQEVPRASSSTHSTTLSITQSESDILHNFAASSALHKIFTRSDDTGEIHSPDIEASLELGDLDRDHENKAIYS